MNNLIKEKYKLDKILQQSRMSTTYFAYNTIDNSKCIVKKVFLTTHDNQIKIKSIEQEAKVLSHLNHKNIPKLLDFFLENFNDENGISCTEIHLVQEYIEGKNLQEILDNERSFSEIEAVEIILKLCNICDYIHSFSPPIIHQDIKPANIIINENKSIYLIDFGAVKQKILSHENSGLSTIIGTQGYMAIEQFEGKPVKGSDIYSMGLTLISLISRKPALLLEKKGLNFTFNDLNISDNLKEILFKMTQPDFNKRYKNVNELKEDLEYFISNIGNKKKWIFNSTQNTKKFIKTQLSDNEKVKMFINSKKIFDWKSLFNMYLKYQVFIFITMAAFSLKFIVGSLILIYFIFSFIKEFKLIKKREYIITDKRLMIIESEKGYKKVESLNLENISSAYHDTNSVSLALKNNFTYLKLEKVKNPEIVSKYFNKIVQKDGK